MAKFPLEIWDGTTSTRPDLTAVQHPAHGDWIIILSELRATQRYLLSLAGNVETMPNLGKSIKSVEELIDELKTRVTQITPPDELHQEVAGLRRQLEEIDIRASHGRLKRATKKILLHTRLSEEVYKKLEAMVLHEVEIIKCSTRNQLADFSREMLKNQEMFQKQIRELQNTLLDSDID